MRIGIVTPAPPRSRSGNRITALRWAKILRRLGNRVSILQAYHDEHYDLLVALHARRSYPSIIKFRRQNPESQIVVALTGTDLYRDLRRNHRTQKSLEIANRIVVLQPKAIEELRPAWRARTRVIFQSVEALPGTASKTKANKAYLDHQPNGTFDVCVIGHLRDGRVLDLVAEVATAGLERPPPYLVVDFTRAMFGNDPSAGAAAYREFVAAGVVARDPALQE